MAAFIRLEGLPTPRAADLVRPGASLALLPPGAGSSPAARDPTPPRASRPE